MSKSEEVKFMMTELSRIRSVLRPTKYLSTIYYTIGNGGPFYTFRSVMIDAPRFANETELQNKIDETFQILQTYLDEILQLCEHYYSEFVDSHYLIELIEMLECAKADNFRITYPPQIGQLLMMHKLSA